MKDEREAARPSLRGRCPAARTPSRAAPASGPSARRWGHTLLDSTEYATLAGFLLRALGAVPARGASVVFGGFRWTVLEMAGPRIVSVRVDREPPAGTPAPSREAGPLGSR